MAGKRNTNRNKNKNKNKNNNTNHGKPIYGDAYAITMNPESERYKQTDASAKAAGITLKKWDAVKVDESMGDSLMEQGIGSIIFKGAKMRYRGAIGCFLAHRGVMRHIAEQPHTTQGTLILEDDVSIPADFNERLNSIAGELPRDWDIIYLDKVNPKSEKISEHFHKFSKQMVTHNNWGNWAYIVRNKSLKDRILPYLEFMFDPVDLQLHKFADKLNIYLTVPSLIKLNAATTLNSNINKLNMTGGARAVGTRKRRRNPPKQKAGNGSNSLKRVILCRKDDELIFIEYMKSICDGDPIVIYDKNTVLEDNKYYLCIRRYPDTKIPPNCKIGFVNTEQLTNPKNLAEYNDTVSKYPGIDLYDYSDVNLSITGKGSLIPYKEVKQETEKLKSFIAAPKAYDVCMIGLDSERRKKFVDKVREKGVLINMFTHVWGDDRDKRIGQAQIFVNLHNDDSFRIYESIRCNRWAYAGMPIITEDSLDNPPKGVIVSKIQDMPDLIVKTLESIKSK
jgi:GR25 family glycosyltransferase involved in LPS biosynthesis